MYYPEIKQAADRVAMRSNKTIARTVVAKGLAWCAYFVLSRQQELKTLKGIEINKLRDWPRVRNVIGTLHSLTSVQRTKPISMHLHRSGVYLSLAERFSRKPSSSGDSDLL